MKGADLILPRLVELAEGNFSHVGIGLGTNPATIKKINNAIDEVKARNLARVTAFHEESELVNALVEGKVQAAVRGGFSSHSFLKLLKGTLNVSKFHRLALLETVQGHQFFFAPVGIDEGRSLEEKHYFIKEGSVLLNTLGLTPRIGILSGGRVDDKGRDTLVDETIDLALKVVEIVKKQDELEIENYNILIEEAIRDGCNLIMSSDGVSGNLIYRTLVHLGSGKSHGALYLGEENTIIDTSRVAPKNEYVSAMIFASGMKK